MAIEWSVVDEIRLFRWVTEFKPAGINKHFNMLSIVERMNNPEKYHLTFLQTESTKVEKVFTAKDLWDKLALHYDLEAMDKIESDYVRAHRNEIADQDANDDLDRSKTKLEEFELPWDEYGDLMVENAKDGTERSDGDSSDIKLDLDYPEEKEGASVEKPLENGAAIENGASEKEDDLKETTEPETKHEEEQDSKVVVVNQDNETQNNAIESEAEEVEPENKSSSVSPVRRSTRLSFKSSKKPDLAEADKEFPPETVKEKGDEISKANESATKTNTPPEEESKAKDDSKKPKQTSDEKEKSIEPEEVEEEQNQEKVPTESVSKEVSDTQSPNEPEEQDENDKKVKDEPLAKRTRNFSSTTPADNDTSPKRKKKKTEPSAPSRRTSTRVSERLRNKK